MFLGKGVLKICSKFTGINLQEIYRKFTATLMQQSTHSFTHPPNPTHPSIHLSHPSTQPIHPFTQPNHPPTHEITHRHGCSPINFLHVFRTPFPKNICRWLLLKIEKAVKCRNINFLIFNNRQEESFQSYFLKPKAVRYFKPFLRDATFSS